MSAGTLSLTNNSAAVTGTGTPFNTELAAGDFIVVTVGGVPYTLPVKSVESATALTLVSVYTGPTQAGAAWSAVPRVAMNLVTAALVAQSAEALRGLNYDKQNWQQVFSGTGTITVRLPDGTTFTGPAWSGISTSIEGKAAKGKNSDITELSGLTTALSITQGGTGSKNPFGVAENTFCQGNDARLNTVDGKSGGTITSGISLPMIDETFSHSIILTAIPGAEGSKTQASIATFTDGSQRVVINNRSVGNRPVTMYSTGGVICQAGLYATGGPSLTSYFLNYENGPVGLWIDNSRLGSIQLVPASDKLLKSDIRYMDKIETTEDALYRVMKWQPATFKYKARGIIPESETKLGFIANDLVSVSPHCVKGDGLKEGFDPLSAEGAYHLDDVAMIAELTQAVQALAQQNIQLRADIEELKLAIKKNE